MALEEAIESGAINFEEGGDLVGLEFVSGVLADGAANVVEGALEERGKRGSGGREGFCLVGDEGGDEHCEGGAKDGGIAGVAVGVEVGEEGAADVVVGEVAEERPTGGSAPGAGVAVDLELDGEGAGVGFGSGEDVTMAGDNEGELGVGGEVVVEEFDLAVDGPKEFENVELAAEGEGGGRIGDELDGDAFGEAKGDVGGEGVLRKILGEIGEGVGDGEGCLGHLCYTNKYLTYFQREWIKGKCRMQNAKCRMDERCIEDEWKLGCSALDGQHFHQTIVKAAALLCEIFQEGFAVGILFCFVERFA